MKAPEFLKYYRNPALLGEDTLPLLRQMVTAFPWFREGWMLYLKNLKNLGHPDYETILHEVALRVNDRRRLKLFLEGDPTRKWDAASTEKEYLPADFQGEDDGTTPGVAGSVSGKRELIENFLAAGATFGNLPGDSGNTSEIDLAEKAAEVSDEIITGRFAELLVCQGQYQGAIDAFNKLALKFPGKSIYFAARIEEVKNKMNL